MNQSRDAIFSEIQKKYTKLIERYAELPAANGYSRVAFWTRQKLLAHQLNKLPRQSLSVLDAGCGNGIHAPVFKEHLKLACLDGADFVAESLQIAHDHFKYSKTFLSNVMSIDTAVAGKKYDLLNSCEMLPYIPPDHYAKFLRAHRNCLKNRGRLLLTLPNMQSVYSLLSNPNAKYPYHLSFDDVLYATSRSGFRITSTVGSDIFGMRLFDLSQKFLKNTKNHLSSEISILCEAV